MLGLLAVGVDVLGVVVVLDGGRDASEEPPGIGIMEDIRNLKKKYTSIYKQKRNR